MMQSEITSASHLVTVPGLDDLEADLGLADSSAGSNARGPGATRSTPCGRPSDGLDRTGRVQGDITGAGSAARGCEGRGDPRVHGAVRLRAHPPRSSVSRPFWEVRPGQRVRRRQLYQIRSTRWR